MAENIQQPTPPSNDYGQFKALPGTGGIISHPDTFYGPRDKVYADFVARDRTRLRGTNAFYYVKTDQPVRIDGDHPLSNNPDIDNDALARKRHAGFALYGEQVNIGQRIDSVRREVEPDWAYSEPIMVRGLAYEVTHQYEPGDRGATYAAKMSFDLARCLCESEWRLTPQPGDIVRLPGAFFDGYFDVNDVSTDRSRWGGTGFFVVFTLSLTRTTRYEPQRKLPPTKTTSDTELKERST